MASFDIVWGDMRVPVGEGKPAFVIAEIGKNFIQSEDERPTEELLANAIALVKAAKQSGASAVKFQTHWFEDEQANIEVVAPHFKGADRYTWVKRNTLGTPVEGFWKPLMQACEDEGILFFSTPMSREAAKILNDLGTPFWKIGSGDLLDFVTLDFIRQTDKPILISSGMSTLEEVDLAVAFLKEKTDKVVLLHCVSRYPCPPEDLHLKTISFYQDRYKMAIGFSDHSITFDSAVASVALGACVVEKHFSFDRALWGSDHKVSLSPDEFKTMVENIRRLEADAAYREDVLKSEIVQRGMGNSEKILDEGEAAFRPVFRKTLCASRDLSAGTVIQPEDLYAMRPQAYLAGLPSHEYPRVLGKTTSRDLKRFDPVPEDALM